MKTKIIAMMLVVSIVFGVTYYSFADTKDELNSQIDDIDEKIAQKEEEISEVEDNLSDAMKEVQDLVGQMI